MSKRTQAIQQVVRQRSGHCRQFSSKGNNNNKKLDVLGLDAMRRAPVSELTPLGMISMSAVALSPLTLAKQAVGVRPPQSKTVPLRRQDAAAMNELSDLYAPTDHATVFIGKDIVEESKQLEAEIDEMILSLGGNPKGDGKSGR